MCSDCTPEVLEYGDFKTQGKTTKKSTYHHNEVIVYTCNNKHSEFVSDKDLIKTCTNGHFLPKFADKPVNCLPGLVKIGAYK